MLLGSVERTGAELLMQDCKRVISLQRFNSTEINSESAFEEELSYRYPGDKISITYTREGKAATTTVTLLNKSGDSNIVKRKIVSDGTTGANLEAVDYGIKISKLRDGLFKQIGLPENYTITHINRQRVKDPQDVIDFFSKYKGRVLLYGFNSSRQELPLSFILK